MSSNFRLACSQSSQSYDSRLFFSTHISNPFRTCFTLVHDLLNIPSPLDCKTVYPLSLPPTLITVISFPSTSNLKIEEHLNKVHSSLASSMQAPGTLRSHGLTGKALQESNNYGPGHVRFAGLVGLYTRAKDQEKLE